MRSFRVGRLAAVLVLVIVAALYVAPVQKYLSVQRQLAHEQTAYKQAAARKAELDRQHALLQTNAEVEILARQCGWIYPGEKPLVVQGLPPGQADCR
jgi:cell division protein FtsB